MLMGHGVTDEIFGISVACEGGLSPYYSYGAMSVAIPGWTLGTLLGAIMGNMLPERVTVALSIALYAMFIAIILPPAKKSRKIAALVAVSMASSGLLTFICQRFSLDWFTEGFRIIALTIVISLAFALLFPKEEEKNEA